MRSSGEPPTFAGVDAGGELLARAVAPLPRVLQADVRIGAQAELLFLAEVVVLEPPELATRRADLEVEATAVEHAKRLVARDGFPNCHVGERHLGGF
jgi:hypothetical protein